MTEDGAMGDLLEFLARGLVEDPEAVVVTEVEEVEGELILELEVPMPAASTYLKAMDRKRFAFALVGVAAARSSEGTRLALAGMAPIPWLLESEEALDEATPLPGNAYKLEIARALIHRALAGVGS